MKGIDNYSNQDLIPKNFHKASHKKDQKVDKSYRSPTVVKDSGTNQFFLTYFFAKNRDGLECFTETQNAEKSKNCKFKKESSANVLSSKLKHFLYDGFNSNSFKSLQKSHRFFTLQCDNSSKNIIFRDQYFRGKIIGNRSKIMKKHTSSEIKFSKAKIYPGKEGFDSRGMHDRCGGKIKHRNQHIQTIQKNLAEKAKKMVLYDKIFIGRKRRQSLNPKISFVDDLFSYAVCKVKSNEIKTFGQFNKFCRDGAQSLSEQNPHKLSKSYEFKND